MAAPANEVRGDAMSRSGRDWLPHVCDVAGVAGVLAAAAIVGSIQYVAAGVDVRLQAMDARIHAMDPRMQAMVARFRDGISALRRDVAQIDARLVRVETIVSEMRK